MSINKQKLISSKNNPFIAGICKLKQKKHRNKTGLFYVEGVKLLKEALDSGYSKNIRYIIASGNIADDISQTAGGNFEIITVTDEVYKKITDEEGFQGVMCVLEKPSEESRKFCYKDEKPVIILNSVRDPGNVGTIIRTADAICPAYIILSDDCSDIYSAKVQRASMGAVFRQGKNIKISKNIKEDIEELRKNGYNIFAAHLDKDSRPVDNIDFGKKTAVVFGNEGSGIDGEVSGICDGKIIIPMDFGGESLNVSVAAGIILWEMRNQLKPYERVI
ncbi:MAG: RNA methyltransferase [Oscillospiraceae bacterium]|nr:RNA methyltransferase [Oscillospiraceae bacterium]